MPQTERIPTIDLLPFFSNNEFHSNDAKKKKIKGVIDQACSQYGFFQIVNHGVSAGLMSQALNLSKTLIFLMKRSSSTVLFLVHIFQLVIAVKLILLQNIYPDNPPEFREVLQEVFSHLTKTGSVIEAILNECLNLSPNFLHDYNLDRKTESNGLSEHQVGNCFTFDGGWIPVVPIEGSIIVNISDVIQVLSNNKYKSATHRVVRPTGERRRHSFAFFYNLEGDAWVKPLPQVFYYKDYQALRLRNKTHPPSYF
ncbi:hypothetical protein MKX03_010960 [Papaver bracteatum]|nr:hypothetical protein MKX03_010960 [Papaver bracteatum]